MGETSGQITQEIEQTRARLGSNLQELETRVKEATDWRKQFRKKPLPWRVVRIETDLYGVKLAGPGGRPGPPDGPGG